MAAAHAQWIEDRSWVWVHYLAVKIGRGELFEALDGLAFLRGTALGPLLAVEHGARPQGVRRIERIVPEAVPALGRTVARPEAISCVEALREAIALYRGLRQETGELVLRSAAEQASVAFLDEIAGGVSG